MTSAKYKKDDNIVPLFPERKEADDTPHPIIGHFFNFFEPLEASSEEEKRAAYKMRFLVYCHELKFEKMPNDGLERDKYDDYARSCLIKHFPTDEYAGTIRLIHSLSDDQPLPMEVFYGDKLKDLDVDMGAFKRKDICEISRIAISSTFRRRLMDCHQGSATGVINELSYSEVEVRCFPLIVVGLYLSAAAMCFKYNIKHAFTMMEKDVARSVKFVGIECRQIGDYVDHHGMRAPYYINPTSLKGLSPAFLALIKEIEQVLLGNKSTSDF